MLAFLSTFIIYQVLSIPTDEFIAFHGHLGSLDEVTLTDKIDVICYKIPIEYDNLKTAIYIPKAAIHSDAQQVDVIDPIYLMKRYKDNEELAHLNDIGGDLGRQPYIVAAKMDVSTTKKIAKLDMIATGIDKEEKDDELYIHDIQRTDGSDEYIKVGLNWVLPAFTAFFKTFGITHIGLDDASSFPSIKGGGASIDTKLFRAFDAKYDTPSVYSRGGFHVNTRRDNPAHIRNDQQKLRGITAQLIVTKLSAAHTAVEKTHRRSLIKCFSVNGWPGVNKKYFIESSFKTVIGGNFASSMVILWKDRNTKEAQECYRKIIEILVIYNWLDIEFETFNRVKTYFGHWIDMKTGDITASEFTSYGLPLQDITVSGFSAHVDLINVIDFDQKYINEVENELINDKQEEIAGLLDNYDYNQDENISIINLEIYTFILISIVISFGICIFGGCILCIGSKLNHNYSQKDNINVNVL